MRHALTLHADLTADQLRATLIATLKADDHIEITLQPLSFTQTRSLLAVVNTLAYTYHCQLKYHNETRWHPSPLDARYTHAP